MAAKLSLGWNACTNYLNTAMQFVQGILVTRWLMSYLGQEQYGLWSIIWSFFMYSILLDFGLGAAAQKVTATEMHRRDIEAYNRTISSVVFINATMSLVIIAGTLAGCWLIRGLLHLPPDADPAYYRQCLLLCGIGSAIIFPFGVFTQILVGLHRLYIRNYVVLAGRIVETIGLGLIVSRGGGVLALLAFTMACNILRCLAITGYVRWAIPGFRLSLRPSGEALRGIAHFSASVYLMCWAKLIWERAAALFLSVGAGLGAVGTYQLGNKLPSMIEIVIAPSQEMFSPLAARLHGYGKTRWLGRILLQYMQLNAFLSNGIIVGLLLFIRPLMRLLLKVDLPEVTLIAQVSILFYWERLLLCSLPDKYLLMAGLHRQVSRAHLGGSVLYLLLGSLAVSLFPDHAGVSVQLALIASFLLVTGVLVLPCLLRSLQLSWWTLCRKVILKPLLVTAPMGALALAEYLLLMDRIHDVWLLLLAGVSGGLTYVASVWLWGLDQRQRLLCRRWLSRKLAHAHSR